MSYPRTDVQFISKETYDGLRGLFETNSVQTLLNNRISEIVNKTGLSNDIVFDKDKAPNKKTCWWF